MVYNNSSNLSWDHRWFAALLTTAPVTDAAVEAPVAATLTAAPATDAAVETPVAATLIAAPATEPAAFVKEAHPANALLVVTQRINKIMLPQ
ncbi:MAG: hypothetical protein WB870_09595 [Gallionellaceae bacterium]